MSENSDSLSRRDFALRAAGAAAVAIPLVAADDSPAVAQGTRPQQLQQQHVLLVDVLRTRFPHAKLTPEIIELLRGDVAGDLGRAIPVNEFPLKNSDEPGFVFAAWRREG